jgi:hypothetical protein
MTIKSSVILALKGSPQTLALWGPRVNYCCLKSPSCSSSNKFTSSHKFYLWFISVWFSHSRLGHRFVSYPKSVLVKWHFFSGYKDYNRPIIENPYDVDDNDDDDNHNDNTICVISHLIKWLWESVMPVPVAAWSKDGHTLVTLPRTVRQYRESAEGTPDRVTLRAFSVCCQYLAVASKGWYGYGLCRCGCATWHATTAAPSSFSLKRNVYKCTKPLLAAKTSLGLP